MDRFQTLVSIFNLRRYIVGYALIKLIGMVIPLVGRCRLTLSNPI
jgi:hypothetical protein